MGILSEVDDPVGRDALFNENLLFLLVERVAGVEPQMDQYTVAKREELRVLRCPDILGADPAIHSVLHDNLLTRVHVQLVDLDCRKSLPIISDKDGQTSLDIGELAVVLALGDNLGETRSFLL